MRVAGTRSFGVFACLAAAAAAGLLVLLLPSTGVGADGVVYAHMARHPFDTAHQLGPYPFRVLVPLLVWLLPGTEFDFHLLSFLGLCLGGSMTALLARDLAVRPRLAVLGSPLYVFSFAGVYAVYQYRMIDAEAAGLTSAALLLAWRGRRLAFVLLGMCAASAREYGATVPLAWWAARRGRGHEQRAIVEAIAVGVPILLTYALLQILVPHPAGSGFMFRNTSYSYFGQFGLLRFFARSLVQGFGLLFLLWPFGLLLGSLRWRSFHLYVIGVIPFLSITDWNRVIIYLLPFAIPSALLVLEREAYPLAVVALGASAYVAVLLSFHNIPRSAGYPAGAAEIVPGAIVGIAAVFPAVWRAVMEIAGRSPETAPAD